MLNNFIMDLDDLIFQDQEQSHSERYNPGRATPNGRGFFLPFFRM